MRTARGIPRTGLRRRRLGVKTGKNENIAGQFLKLAFYHFKEQRFLEVSRCLYGEAC